MRRASYHNHTTFSDGINTPQETVRVALEKGFTGLGISDHSLFPYAMDWHIPPRELAQYFTAIHTLARQLQQDGIPLAVFAGVEADYMPILSSPDFSQYKPYKPDYIIGSAHYVLPRTTMPTNAVPVCADSTAPEITTAIQTAFCGSAQEFVRSYWHNVRTMMRISPIDIVGHMDIIKKENVELNLFSEDDSWYRDEVARTIETAVQNDIIVEINTGAIGRGSLKEIYPSPWILTWLYQAGAKLTINSDSHSAATLDTAYDYAYRCAANAGYTHLMHLDRETDGSCTWNAYPM